MAAAIHAGHRIRSDVIGLLAVDEQTRLREEDPFTDRLTGIAPNRIVVSTSRFEVDLNRPPEKAVYLTPEDAWGIDVWRAPPPPEVVRQSLGLYERFYGDLTRLLEELLAEHARSVVLDLHSYCHRRGGPGSPVDDPAANPEVNLGTASVDREKWSSLVERLAADLRAFDFDGRGLDVRENVRFRGGHFSSWINRRYPGRVCAIAIELKKTFMDEWTGRLAGEEFALVLGALQSAVPGLLEELDGK